MGVVADKYVGGVGQSECALEGQGLLGWLGVEYAFHSVDFVVHLTLQFFGFGQVYLESC